MPRGSRKEGEKITKQRKYKLKDNKESGISSHTKQKEECHQGGEKIQLQLQTPL